MNDKIFSLFKLFIVKLSFLILTENCNALNPKFFVNIHICECLFGFSCLIFELWKIGDSSITIPPLSTPTSSHVMAKMSNKFSLLNSFWFAFSSLMQQANYASPNSMSGRIVSAVWWFFTFILISSYTANFAALLTIERMTTPINSVEELAAQRSIQFGTLLGSSTMEFFKVNIFAPNTTYLFLLRVKNCVCVFFFF